MEHAASEVSEAYTDVFEEEMPDQSADAQASDAASIRSGMTLSRSLDNLPGEDCQEEKAYIRSKWLDIWIQFMPTATVRLYMLKTNTNVGFSYAGPAETQCFTSMPTSANVASKPGSIRSAGIRQPSQISGLSETIH